MKKSTILLLLFLVVAVLRPSFATEPFDFASDVIRSLQVCKVASKRIKTSESQDLVSKVKDIYIFMNGIHQANSMITPHRNSKNEMIRKSADSFSTIYSSIVENNEQLVSFLEQMLNDPKEAASKQGTWLRKLSENMAVNEELWLKLPYATAATAYTLVDLKRTENGNLRFLTITKVEKDKLLSQLHAIFGDQVRGGLHQVSPFPVDVSAASLWEFLSKEWKPIDTK